MPLLCANANPKVPYQGGPAPRPDDRSLLQAACLRALLEHLRFCARLAYVSHHLDAVTYCVLDTIDFAGAPEGGGSGGGQVRGRPGRVSGAEAQSREEPGWDECWHPDMVCMRGGGGGVWAGAQAGPCRHACPAAPQPGACLKRFLAGLLRWTGAHRGIRRLRTRTVAAATTEQATRPAAPHPTPHSNSPRPTPPRHPAAAGGGQQGQAQGAGERRRGGRVAQQDVHRGGGGRVCAPGVRAAGV